MTIKETISETGATQLSIEDTYAYAFRSKVEQYGTLFAWQAGPRRRAAHQDRCVDVSGYRQGFTG